MSSQQIVIYNVYAPNHYRDKEVCWASLSNNIAEEDSNNIILGGDLNLILHANEKRGGNFTPDPFRNQLENIMQDAIIDNAGTQHNDQTAIKSAASDNFKELLTETREDENYADLLQHLPKKIAAETNERLAEEIKEEEFNEAIWGLQPDKAIGLDDFPICFYREYWEMIKKDLIKYFKWIQRKNKIGGYTNSTHLALIPKENRPSNFSRFRPISLCNSSYKIFTKVLASRLKPLLPMLISENQGGFMANRQISDSILLVQEASHSSHSRNEKGFILKLDLANAFDRVKHSFLFVVLQKMGFSSSFIDIIRACISGPSIAPLINDRPGPTFRSSRGLRQGCPLSPYLFLLMAESFSCALDHKRQTGLITGIKFEDGVKKINHSQFADATLLIGGASAIIARRFKSLLDKFMRYSRGMINHFKSCIYGWNASAQTLQSTASIFGVPCKLNWDHFSYLGMPVSIGNARPDVWELTLDKMKRKVQKWGTTWLNPARQLVLLKSGLSSLPLYQFSLAQAPTSFHHKMDSVLRFLLWQGGKNERRKFNLVVWKQVIQNQEKRGLGIIYPTLTNSAFGGKIIWRLIEDQSAWWKKVLEAKYLSHPRQQLLTTEIPNRNSTRIWKLYKKAISFMAQNVSKVPKGGSKINIGTDKIMGNQPICSLPGMTSIILFLQSKGIHSLDKITQWDAITHTWKRWSLPPIPQHLKENLDNFQKHLHNIAPTIENGKDEFRWDPTGTSYSTQAGYDYLCNRDYPPPTWMHWKTVWKSEAIPKVKFFMWTLLKEKTLTAKNLKKRGIAGPSRYPNCHEAGESIQHLFIACPFSFACWNSINLIAPPIWNSQLSIREVLNNWKKNYPWQSMKNNIAKRVWDALPLALLWRIWIARNNKIFKDKETSIRHLCSKAKSLAIETIASKSTKKIDITSLWAEEKDFIRSLIEMINIHPTVKICRNLGSTHSQNWKIRLKQDDFNKWLHTSNTHSLFFDGASKSNTGAAGAGGIICNPNGKPLVTFEWGLGILSNNRAEALALYQGILQLQI
eukprot:PITA_10059